MVESWKVGKLESWKVGNIESKVNKGGIICPGFLNSAFCILNSALTHFLFFI